MTILHIPSNEIAWVNRLEVKEGNVIPLYADVNVIDNKVFQAEQCKDPVIAPVLDSVRKADKPEFTTLKKWSTKSRQLMRYFRDLYINKEGTLMKSTKESRQIVLPKVHHQTVYKELHQNMGHLGSQRVLELVKYRFFWPGMANDIEDFITKRCECLKGKKPNIVEKAKLVNIKSTAPFEIGFLTF